MSEEKPVSKYVQVKKEIRVKPTRDERGAIIPGGVHRVIDPDAGPRTVSLGVGGEKQIVTPNKMNDLKPAIFETLSKNPWYVLLDRAPKAEG